MKLHLPVRLFKSVLACLAAVASFSLGSGVAWAEAQNLTFSGSSLTWDTSAENKSFVDEEDAAASFAAGDNVSFTGESAVTLGENITVGTLDIATGADVTIDLEEYTLHTDTISLSGTLAVGNSLSIASGSTLAVKNAAAVLDSALVLGEKSGLVVESAASLNSHTLTLQGGSNLILTADGDGKTYTLFSGISSLVDKNGNTLTAGSYSINDYFDKDAPGSGFWADATLVYTADGTLQIVRHNETVKAPLEITESKTGPQDYNYYKSISFLDCSIDSVDGDNIELNNNGSVTFSGNTASSDRAIFVSVGGTIMLSNNGSVEFSGYTASSGGAILGEGTDSTELSNNGSVVFEGNKASSSSFASGGAICGTFSTIELNNNGRVEFCGNKTSSSSYHAYGGAIYGDRDIDMAHNGSVWFSGNSASGFSSGYGGAIYSVAGGCRLLYNDIVSFRGNRASSTSSTAFGGAIYGANRTSVTLRYNGSVTFSGNTASVSSSSSSYSDADAYAYAYGGAIYGGTITLSNNGSVTFSGNTASASSGSSSYPDADAYAYAYGGAIYGGSNSSITLSNNGSVSFSGNTASGSFSAYGGAIYGDTITLSNNGSVMFSGNTASDAYFAHGGAIYGRDITLSNNASVKFIGNKIIETSSAYGYACGMLHGGAISGSDITLSNNGSVEFCGNQLVNDMGFVYQYYGGAIYGSDITLNNNARVLFNENMSTLGGAISGSDITLSNNGSVEFCGNTSYRAGGAIYTDGSLHIRNNESVEFAGNVEEGRYATPYRLRSVYVVGGSGDVFSISAAAGKSVVFYDTIYVRSGTTVNLNSDYEDAEGNIIEQKGDIVFTGATTVADLYKAKGNVDGTEEEIRLSRTSEVLSTANLYNGCLIIKEGAIWSGAGITVDPLAGGTGKPTLLLQNGTLAHDASSVTNRNVVTIKSGGAFEVAGKSQADYTSLVLEGGSSWIFNIGSDNTAADSAVLSMENSSLTLPGSGKVTLQLNAATGLAHGKAYALLSGIAQPTGWNADTITITSGTFGLNAGFSNLTWADNTLWLYYDARPALVTATWTNESGDGKWNTSSVNWEQNEIDYEYKNGVAVVFDGQGAGTVDLVGELAPGSVLVNNAAGQDYSFGGSGSLAGDMKLTKKGAGNLIISTANSYTGGTEIDNSLLTITHANALGTGGIVTKGNSRLVVNGVTLKLQGTIDNTAGGELSLKGALDASALAYTYQSDTRVSLDGLEVEKTKSGFGKDGQYQVVIVNGGTTKNEGVMVQHDNHRLRIPLMLGADGVAYASMAGVDYSRYHLTGDDSIAVSEIADVSYRESGMELVYVDMDGGELEVDQSIAVNATGGSISITDDAVLSGTVEDTAVSTATGDYSSEISALLKGDTTLEVKGGSITVSGDNSYSGGTVVNGGTLLAGHNKAFGAGDVSVNRATLDLNGFTIANIVRLNGNSTLGHADGASHIVLGGGSTVNFRDGFTLSAGKVLEVDARSATYTGALTLGGGTIELDGKLTVQGDVVFESGKQTTIDISGWSGAGDGEVLVDFGSNSSGYTNDSLALSGIAGDWELKFDSATGNLVLAAVRDDFSPNLDRNQQAVYDTVKDIMGAGNPGGVLGLLGQEVAGSRDEAALKRVLDELSGREYATIMSSQMEGNMGHLRRLRAAAGAGTPLGEYVSVSYCYPSNKGVDKSDNKGASVQIAPSPVVDSRRLRAGISVFHEEGELDSDNNGDGYDRSETGAQLTMEYMVSNEFIMGMGISQSRTRLTPDYGKRRHEDNTHFDLYGVYQSGRWSTTTALGLGLHQHDLGRTVAGMQTEAEADGFSVNFLQEVAYTVWADEQQGVQVYGAVESSFNQVDSFTETGAGNASLTMDSQEAWATDVTLGLRYNHALPALDKALPGTLSLHAGVVASLGDVEETSTMRFAGAPGYSFRQGAAERNRWGYSVGVSVNLPVSANVAAFGSAEAVLRGDSYTADAQLGLKVAF